MFLARLTVGLFCCEFGMMRKLIAGPEFCCYFLISFRSCDNKHRMEQKLNFLSCFPLIKGKKEEKHFTSKPEAGPSIFHNYSCIKHVKSA